jgi:hypothetical protein
MVVPMPSCSEGATAGRTVLLVIRHREQYGNPAVVCRPDKRSFFLREAATEAPRCSAGFNRIELRPLSGALGL